MTGGIMTPDGWVELNYRELSRQEADSLTFAGESVEFRETAKEAQEKAVRAYEELILLSLHFRAYRNLKREGYTLDDIAGFVRLTEAEIAAEYGGSIAELRHGCECRFYGTKYYFKQGLPK